MTRTAAITNSSLFPLQYSLRVWGEQGTFPWQPEVFSLPGIYQPGSALNSCHQTSVPSASSDTNSHFLAADELLVEGTELVAGGPGVAQATSLASSGSEPPPSPPPWSPAARPPPDGDAAGPALPPLPSLSHPSCSV